MIDKVMKYKVLDQHGQFIGFKTVDVTKNKIEYQDAVGKTIKGFNKGTKYLQQFVVTVRHEKKKVDIYSGDLLSLYYSYNKEYKQQYIIGFHDRIRAFKMFSVNGRRSCSIGTLKDFTVIDISNVIESNILLALKGGRVDQENYIIEEEV
jgi:hypothetical protein